MILVQKIMAGIKLRNNKSRINFEDITLQLLIKELGKQNNEKY